MDLERPPTVTWDVTFERPEEYCEFLETFGFEGVGISGGEPFSVFDLSLRYVGAIRRRFGKDFYLWIYTNGDPVTRENLQRIKAAGLDEIRFNVAGNGYRLDKVRLARSVFDTVTVEIPAIPEHFELLMERLPEMAELGVSHLNLHQMYATRENYRSLIGRDYTFLHGSSPQVLESELTALRVIEAAQRRGIDLPINYCCSAYKDRYQASGFRLRAGRRILDGHDELTPTGYVRRFKLEGPPESIGRVADQLAAAGSDRFEIDRFATRLYLHRVALKQVDWRGLKLSLEYHEPTCTEDPALGNSNCVTLAGGKKLFGRLSPVAALDDIQPAIWDNLCAIMESDRDPEEMLRDFFMSAPITGPGGARELAAQFGKVRSVLPFERMPYGLAEIV
jgi:pyruvate formate-lyase activating enzyme-like uncharacterized protein